MKTTLQEEINFISDIIYQVRRRILMGREKLTEKSREPLCPYFNLSRYPGVLLSIAPVCQRAI